MRKYQIGGIKDLNAERDDLIVDCLRKISKKSTLDDTDREFLEYLANSIGKERNQPVIHAKWYRTDAYPHHIACSNCYKNYVTNEEIIGRYCTTAEYCPHCGAKMDK